MLFPREHLCRGTIQFHLLGDAYYFSLDSEIGWNTGLKRWNKNHFHAELWRFSLSCSRMHRCPIESLWSVWPCSLVFFFFSFQSFRISSFLMFGNFTIRGLDMFSVSSNSFEFNVLFYFENVFLSVSDNSSLLYLFCYYFLFFIFQNLQKSKLLIASLCCLLVKVCPSFVI